jgi:hypothetical protein
MKVDLVTHKFQAKAGQMNLTSVNHHIRMTNPNDEGIFYLQGGRVFAGENHCIPKDEVPDWVHERIKLMNPKVLAQCGFGDKGAETKLKAMTDPDRYKKLNEMGHITDEELIDLLAKSTTVIAGDQELPLTAEQILAETREELGEEEPDSTIAILDQPDYSTWKRPQLMAECKDKDIKISPSDKNADLIAKLQA